MDDTESVGAKEASGPPYLACCLLLLVVGIVGAGGAYVLASAPTHTPEGAQVMAHPAGERLASVSFSLRDEVQTVDHLGQPWSVVEGELVNKVSISLSSTVKRVVASGPWVAVVTKEGVNLVNRDEGTLDSLRAKGDRLALDGDWAASASVTSATVTLSRRSEDLSWFGAEKGAPTLTPLRGGSCQALALGSGLLAVCNELGEVTVFDVETLAVRAELKPPAELSPPAEGASVVALAFSEDGEELAAALESDLVVWSLEKEKVTLHATVVGASLTALGVGKGVYVVGDSAGAVTAYGRSSKGEPELYFPYAAEPPLRPVSAVKSIAISGWRFAWCVNDQLFVFDVATLPIRIRKGSRTYTLPR